MYKLHEILPCYQKRAKSPREWLGSAMFWLRSGLPLGPSSQFLATSRTSLAWRLQPDTGADHGYTIIIETCRSRGNPSINQPTDGERTSMSMFMCCKVPARSFLETWSCGLRWSSFTEGGGNPVWKSHQQASRKRPSTNGMVLESSTCTN